jgi:hypothetical protein
MGGKTHYNLRTINTTMEIHEENEGTNYGDPKEKERGERKSMITR